MRSAIKPEITTRKPSASEPKPGCRTRSLARARFLAPLLLLLFLPVAASAYTVIMRGGRRIEIPDNFIVTRSTLTYEAAPGINVTLQLSSIDIPATERINNEATGSLLRRADARTTTPPPASREATPADAAPPQSAPPRSRRTITNRDLEASRKARQAGEEAYERRRIELGLPSLEEIRRRNEEEARRLSEQSRLSYEEEAQAETYWRARATELRTEIAVVDAEFNYLRNRLGQLPRPTLFAGSYTVVTGAVPFYPFRPRVFPHAVNSFGAVGTGGPQVVGSIGFGGGSTRGRVLVNVPGPATNSFGRHTFFPAPRVFVPPFGQYAASYPFYDSSYDRTVLLTRLHELESVRAGLDARWRLLEEEARRAGAPPGWLRP